MIPIFGTKEGTGRVCLHLFLVIFMLNKINFNTKEGKVSLDNYKQCLLILLPLVYLFSSKMCYFLFLFLTAVHHCSASRRK